jgi:hypothetical protein
LAHRPLRDGIASGGDHQGWPPGFPRTPSRPPVFWEANVCAQRRRRAPNGQRNPGYGPPDWKQGDRIPRGRETLEVIEVRPGEKVTLVVRGHVQESD